MKLPCLDIPLPRAGELRHKRGTQYQHAAQNGRYFGYSSCSATQPDVASP
ncbi:hypothetical protein BCO71033_05427 [Burkholderia contaminans]|uniref:Uncharacterized protein n=1 Tax=Burkholderia contaminans TaxID=488447 RepID=A0A6P3B5D3_9BURK|nr:hypothetical protein BCO71033_05427 [Burkholderia contaminans]